jgi:DNA modification methylase
LHAPRAATVSSRVQKRGKTPVPFPSWQQILDVVQPQLRAQVATAALAQGNSLEVLDALFAKFPDGCFDCIFADPPYFLSNGGITCHAGKMVKVDKGDWDKSKGPELNHEFNTEWLKRCQRVIKPHGTIWVTGTHHVIFSVGFAMQQLGMKILNDITWEKPNPLYAFNRNDSLGSEEREEQTYF